LSQCSIYNILGTATTKKGAKRYVARLMFKTIFDIGPEKFGELKSAHSITQLLTKVM